jgi:hypothetical protein
LSQQEDERWRRSKPPASGPSTPPNLTFDPLATGIAVFTAVTIPIVVIDYGLDAGPSTAIIVGGIVLGLLAGVLAGIWVARRGGRLWRGPRL